MLQQNKKPVLSQQSYENELRMSQAISNEPQIKAGAHGMIEYGRMPSFRKRCGRLGSDGHRPLFSWLPTNTTPESFIAQLWKVFKAPGSYNL